MWRPWDAPVVIIKSSLKTKATILIRYILRSRKRIRLPIDGTFEHFGEIGRDLASHLECSTCWSILENQRLVFPLFAFLQREPTMFVTRRYCVRVVPTRQWSVAVRKLSQLAVRISGPGAPTPRFRMFGAYTFQSPPSKRCFSLRSWLDFNMFNVLFLAYLCLI